VSTGNENPLGNPRITRVNDPTMQSDEPREFEQFQALTQKVVNVPKTELDEKRKDA
jgi:hypothetical protein